MKDLKKKEELLNLEPLKIEEEVIYGGFSSVLEGDFSYENNQETNILACGGNLVACGGTVNIFKCGVTTGKGQ